MLLGENTQIILYPMENATKSKAYGGTVRAHTFVWVRVTAPQKLEGCA